MSSMTLAARTRDVAVAVLTLALMLTFVRHSDEPGMVLSAEFDRAGLNVRVDDEVRIRGVPVGHIAEIEVTEDRGATYHLELEPDAAVAADSGARIVPKTLFGDKFVELDPASADTPSLQSGDVIPRERTRPVSELEEVLDRLGGILTELDVVAIASTVDVYAEALGDGEDLARAMRGVGSMAELASTERDAFRGLLASAPPVTETFTHRAGELESITHDLSQVAGTLADERETFATTLRSNADLFERASRLVADDRLAELTDDGLTVLDIVADHPGAVEEYLGGVPDYLEGVVDAVFLTTLYALVPHMLIGLPHVAGHEALERSDAERGSGPGPHVVVDAGDEEPPAIPPDGEGEE
jgi:phospholipid/cholesterol/gamma-HCH transport system substrate-binding protein